MVLSVVCLVQGGIIAYYSADYIGSKLSLVGNSAAQQDAYREAVNVSVVTKSKFIGNIATYGKIKSMNSTVLKVPNFSGYKVSVSDIRFKSGDFVNKGDILIVFKCDELMYKLQASLKDYEQHREYFRRIDKAKSSIAEHEHIKAKIAYEKADAEYKSLKATYDSLILRAPFDGVLGHPNIVVGDQVGHSEKIISTMVDHERLNVEFYVDASNVKGITRSTPILVETLDGDAFAEAAIQGISPYIEENSGKVKIIARLLTNSGSFKHNLNVNVAIDKKPLENVFVIPRNAVIEDGSSYYICKIEKNKNLMETRIIKVFVADTKGDHYAIVSDALRDGDYIAVEGMIRRDYVPVNIQRIID